MAAESVEGEYLRTSGAMEMYDVITGSPTQWFDLKRLGIGFWDLLGMCLC